MNSLSVIIPSRTLSNLEPCVQAIKKHEPEALVFVVDDLRALGVFVEWGYKK